MKPVIALLGIISFVACKKEINTTPPQLSVPFVNTDFTQRFIPFGEWLSSGKENPGYHVYLTDSTKQVFASTGGTVSEIKLNDDLPDYEIEIEPFEYSVYHIYYRHIKNPVVAEGQLINTGDVLGVLGIGGQTEFQILDTRDGQAVCPESFGTALFNTGINLAINKTNLHNGSSYSMACLKDKVAP
jgi:hypothetical protein